MPFYNDFSGQNISARQDIRELALEIDRLAKEYDAKLISPETSSQELSTINSQRNFLIRQLKDRLRQEWKLPLIIYNAIARALLHSRFKAMLLFDSNEDNIKCALLKVRNIGPVQADNIVAALRYVKR